MKVLVFGVVEMVGTSKKTGAAYQMRKLLIGSPVSNAHKEAYSRRAAGFECSELECEDHVVEACLGLRFPLVLNVETDMRPIGGRLAPIAVGVSEVPAVKAA
jgi:hypothetical protein